jgi:hypothetical protein
LIENKINDVLQDEPFALVCMVGNKGAGKSVLGKFFRKHGLGGFKPREIAVIDDDCMSTYFLWLFRPQISVPCTGVDELEPFFKYCKKRKVIFYISSNPEKRISKASILLRIDMADEELRRKRLIKRYGTEKGIIFYNKLPRRKQRGIVLTT